VLYNILDVEALMKGRLTDKEKQELRKLLEEQDKPQDDSWLMADHYAKLSKKENPKNYGCLLCDKTHFPKNCPNRKAESKPKYTYSYYNHDSGDGD
jgi:hypothetical protein